MQTTDFWKTPKDTERRRLPNETVGDVVVKTDNKWVFFVRLFL